MCRAVLSELCFVPEKLNQWFTRAIFFFFLAVPCVAHSLQKSSDQFWLQLAELIHCSSSASRIRQTGDGSSRGPRAHLKLWRGNLELFK